MRRGVRNGSLRLKGVMQIRRGDRTYRYLRRKGQPLVALPDLPMDDPAFLAAYAAALQAAPEPASRSQASPNTIAALIEAATRSERFASRSAVYRATLRRQWTAIREKAGTAPYAGLREKHVRADVMGAENAEARLKAWRFVLGWAVDAGLLEVDPSRLVTADRRQTRGHEPWSRAEIEAFRQRWPIGRPARLAMELLLWTGARRDDATKLGPGMVGRDGVLSFRQGKTSGFAFVPWSCRIPQHVAHGAEDHAHLMAAIAARTERHMTFLATAGGAARSSNGLGNLIADAARAAGLDRSAHGLRKSRAIALAEGGATPHQIGAWTGHASLKEVEHYTRESDRRRAVIGTDPEQKSANTPGPKVQTPER